MTKKQKRNRNKIIISLVLYIVLFFVPVSGIIKLCLYLIPYLIVGYKVLIKAFKNILNGRVFDENFLMCIATIGAFACKEFPEAVAVMLFYQIGELFESIAVGKSRKSIANLMDIMPEFAMVLRNGIQQEVFPEEVEIGEVIIVKAGERIPLDGIIIEGASSLDTSALTGESMPYDVFTNDQVLSGSINKTGVLKIKVSKTYENSTVAKILDLVENASSKKSKAENFVTKFARYYTPAVVYSAVALAIIPSIITGNWSEWIQKALAFLVVSCPCALVISIPLSFFSGIGKASSQGILVKGSNYLEALASASTVVFDKTGTLTKALFSVSKINAINISEETLLEITALVESQSTHPISKAIVDKYGKTLDITRLENIMEISGHGVTALVDGKNTIIGNEKLMIKHGIDYIKNIDGTILHVAYNNAYCGYILLEDEVKENAKETISLLKKVGIKNTVMLTGDNEKTALKVANKLNIDKVYSKLLPEDKVTKVEEILNEKTLNEKVIFVGDGINDAPVLSRVDIGIAMGAMGSDCAIEAADIVLMNDDLPKIVTAIQIAKRTLFIVKQNIVFALGIKFAVLLLTAFGVTGMWAAVFADVGVSIIAILNARRV